MKVNIFVGISFAFIDGLLLDDLLGKSVWYLSGEVEGVLKLQSEGILGCEVYMRLLEF